MNKNMIIIGSLIFAVVAVIGMKKRAQTGGCSFGGDSSGICTLPIPGGQPMTEDPQAVVVPVEKSLPSMLELGSVNCVPCKMMAPILDELRESFDGQLDVNFIDVWKNEEAGTQYGIRAIPTQIFFDAKGTEIFRHEGFYPREDIVVKWKELGYGFAGPQKPE